MTGRSGQEIAKRFICVHSLIAAWPSGVRSVGAMPALSRVRHVACEGAFNIRDIGGYPTSSGRPVRGGVVYRADGLHRIPPGGASALRPLGWRTVIDLRTTREVACGAYRAEGVEVINLPMLRATWGIPEATEIDPVEFLSGHYLQMLDEGARAIAEAFATLGSQVRLPAVFHCSAGKDRTGVLAALVLSALGVPEEVIAADYHLSAPAVEKLVEWMRVTRTDPSEEMPRQPQAVLSCPPEAMHTFLAGVRARFGSVEGYLTSIGIGAGAIQRLRRTLLDPT